MRSSSPVACVRRSETSAKHCGTCRLSNSALTPPRDDAANGTCRRPHRSPRLGQCAACRPGGLPRDPCCGLEGGASRDLDGHECQSRLRLRSAGCHFRGRAYCQRAFVAGLGRWRREFSRAPYIVTGARWGVKRGPQSMVEALDWTYRDPLSLELMGETAENLAASVCAITNEAEGGVHRQHGDAQSVARERQIVADPARRI